MAIAAVALVSCKKDNVDDRTLGSATITGTIRADIDQSNDVNGAGIYQSYLNPEGVAGMIVTAEVNTEDWADNYVWNYDYDVMTYTATTDANGMFTMTIPTPPEGYEITLEFQDVNGVTRTLWTQQGSTVEETSYIYKNSEDVWIYDGADLDLVFDASITDQNTDNYEYATATIRGDINLSYDIANWDALPPANQKLDASSGQSAQSVVWYYETAPYGNGYGQEFSVAVNSDGSYEVTIPTEALLETDVVIDLGMFDFVGPQIMNNNAGTADSTRQVVYSSGGLTYLNNQSLSAGDIVIYDINLTYSTF